MRTKSKLYSIWLGMKQRCNNRNSPSWPRYGGRGITICKEWSDFEVFERDMGPRPSPAHSIDRIDNDRGYSPDNCRWATATEQVHNRRCARFVQINGVSYRAIDLAKITGRKLDTIMKRVSRGLSYDEVIQAERVNNPQARDIAKAAADVRADQQIRASHCINGHEWTAENTRILKSSGNRRCIACLRAAEFRARQKRHGKAIAAASEAKEP